MEYYDLGSHGRPVTTDSAEAQLWFDRGLVWTYAFHHEEAVACFEKAAAADPDCAMAHWGIGGPDRPTHPCGRRVGAREGRRPGHQRGARPHRRHRSQPPGHPASVHLMEMSPTVPED